MQNSIGVTCPVVILEARLDHGAATCRRVQPNFTSQWHPFDRVVALCSCIAVSQCPLHRVVRWNLGVNLGMSSSLLDVRIQARLIENMG